MKRKKLQPHYSGVQSVQFWRGINRYRGTVKHEELYRLGCILQNIEGDVLRQIDIVKQAEVMP